MRVKTLLLGAAAAAVVAGCGSEAQSGPLAQNASEVGGSANNDATFHYERRTTVTIGDGGYSPSDLRIEPNTTVEWVNRDDEPHTVRWTRGSSQHFASGPIAPGDSFVHRFAHVGNVDYHSAASGDAKYRGTVRSG